MMGLAQVPATWLMSNYEMNAASLPTPNTLPTPNRHALADAKPHTKHRATSVITPVMKPDPVNQCATSVVEVTVHAMDIDITIICGIQQVATVAAATK
jgi:hypothetical protein